MMWVRLIGHPRHAASRHVTTGRLTVSGMPVTEWITTSTILHGLRDYENRVAWGRFIDRFRRPIVRFARNAGLTDNDAEDVAQDALAAFAEAYRRGDYNAEKGRLSRWLFGIAHNHILRHRRGDARRAAKVVQAGNTTFWQNVEDEETAADVWDREWEQALYRECIERVRPEFEPATLEAFELVMREDARPADVAEKLGVSVRSVYNAKHRILKRLRELRSDLEELA